LSRQKSTQSVVFGPPPKHEIRSLVTTHAADEPGPGNSDLMRPAISLFRCLRAGHYIDPLKEGRGEQGEVKAVLSTQHNLSRVVFGKHKIRRDLAKPGAEHEPGPGCSRPLRATETPAVRQSVIPRPVHQPTDGRSQRPRRGAPHRSPFSFTHTFSLSLSLLESMVSVFVGETCTLQSTRGPVREIWPPRRTRGGTAPQPQVRFL
jgi:hypothetical protein